MMKNRLIRYLGLVIGLTVLVAVGLVGCDSKDSSGSDSSSELTKIKFGTSAWPTSMFAYLADDLGYFKDEGIDVDLKTFGSFSDSLQAFVGGNLDIITSASPDTIAPFSRNADFKVISVTDKSHGADGMVTKSSIKSIEDLKGKTVATELYSVDHMYLLQLLDKAGMSEDDITLTNMSIADAGTAIISGNVDAAVVWEPYLSKALDEGDTNLLYSSADNPDLITDSLLASDSIIDDNSEAVQGFVNAWWKAVAYWRDNQTDAEKIMAKYMDVEPADFRAIMETLYIPTPEESLASLSEDNDTSFVSVNTNVAKFLKELDVTDTVPDVSKMVDTQFVEKYVKNEE